MVNSTFWPYVLVMAGVTYLIRMLPLAAFNRRIQSRFLQSLLAYVPYAVLGAMTFPAVFQSTGHPITALCGLAVGLTLGLLEKWLLTVALCACAAAFVAGLFC